MENQDLVVKTINKLHKLGFKIMMDDFGSGYSSLNVLKDLEIDYLKVDMKFLQQDMEFNGKGEKVLTSVIRMAKWLHLPSIVEGVETMEQVDFLKCIGCEYAQGFFYAKPMPVEDYEKFIEKEEEMGAQPHMTDDASIVSELWNTRSHVSIFFDILDIPISIYEYRNDKLELLRGNAKFENDVMYNKSMSDAERDEKMKSLRNLLADEFEKLVKGEFCEPIEFELSDDIWYRISVKIIAKRVDTLIMMATFCDISEFKCN
jgi:hypothetical protein